MPVKVWAFAGIANKINKNKMKKKLFCKIFFPFKKNFFDKKINNKK